MPEFRETQVKKLSKTRRLYSSIMYIDFNVHLIISVIVRLSLIWYSELHDSHSEVPYTDIDYKVVTDGARHIFEGSSPFLRHTYRYSPIFALIQLPNVAIHSAIGKIIYVFFDILVALLLYNFIKMELRYQRRKAIISLLKKFGKSGSILNYNEVGEQNKPEIIARISAYFWLYNPLTAIISTRGNGDSFSSFFVILTLYILAKSEDSSNRRGFLIFTAGLTHGLAIHLRLYPIFFSLAYYLSLSDRLTWTLRDFLKQLWFPSSKQLLLITGTGISFLTITGFFYHIYGYQYIYEAYLYHFTRIDVRHNFSLYFLMQYLSEQFVQFSLIEKFLVIGPQICLIFFLSFSFGQFRQTLPFCVFTLAFVIVTFNSVVTSQYFVWYLALLPLCLNNLQSISIQKAVKLFLVWICAQGLWLLPAYLLEFKTLNTFYWIGFQSLLLFFINNLLMACMIKHYSFTLFKINFRKLL